jgi:hypothetical protein
MTEREGLVGLLRSGKRRRRLTFLSAAVFAAAAIVSWWSLSEEGAGTAKLIAACATSVGALVQFVSALRWRART